MGHQAAHGVCDRKNGHWSKGLNRLCLNVRGQHYRTIWVRESDPGVVQLIDQRWLPHEFVIEDVGTVEQMAAAIKEMHVRGAGLIGAAAGYGMYLATLEAAREGDFDAALTRAAKALKATRPTARMPAWRHNGIAVARWPACVW